jgi:ribosome-associated protein
MQREDGLTQRVTQGTHAGRIQVPSAEGAVAKTLALVLGSLDDDKAEDIVAIDLQGRSSIADHMVIASGRSARQVSAIAEKLAERLKVHLGRTPRMEGRNTGDWVLIDGGDVVVHVFRPEVRDFYQLERMWLEPDALQRRGSA